MSEGTTFLVWGYWFGLLVWFRELLSGSRRIELEGRRRTDPFPILRPYLTSLRSSKLVFLVGETIPQEDRGERLLTRGKRGERGVLPVTVPTQPRRGDTSGRPTERDTGTPLTRKKLEGK